MFRSAWRRVLSFSPGPSTPFVPRPAHSPLSRYYSLNLPLSRLSTPLSPCNNHAPLTRPSILLGRDHSSFFSTTAARKRIGWSSADEGLSLRERLQHLSKDRMMKRTRKWKILSRGNTSQSSKLSLTAPVLEDISVRLTSAQVRRRWWGWGSAFAIFMVWALW
jgi:hypothetical protein